jgi:hypothetical protein
MKITQELCDKCVDVLTEEGYNASVLECAPNQFAVYIDSVWDSALQNATSFRLHDEDITYHASHWSDKNT